MKDIIDLLLQKREDLHASKEKAIAEALVKIDDEYADRERDINAMLDLAGYTDPVVDDTPIMDEAPVVDEVAHDTEAAPELAPTTDEPMAKVINGRIVTF